MLFQESVANVFLELVLVFFSDEACFTLNANFNNRNSNWHSENLFAVHEVTLCELIVRVWCALRVYKIIQIVLCGETVNST
jgi:hypothetical protein